MKRNQRLRHGAPRYIIGLVTSTGSMLATVALLACFAVVVMPSLFTVAPNRRAGLPSPSDSAPQAAVSAPVERKKTSEDERTACILRYFCVVAPCSGRGADWSGGSAGSCDGRRRSILSCWHDSGPSTSSSPCIASARSSEHEPSSATQTRYLN